MSNILKKQKIASEAGADRRTPSVPQYFSWINNTNEGSTETQTIINLDFFAWLKKTYGMEIKIYAWDAGNFDGASGGYGDADGAKFKSQYPNGYDPVVKRAAEVGIRMGLWGSPDGFGDTPEVAKKRYDFMVDLCRKHHFALFKVDGVCGNLRPEKAPLYAQMLRDCRTYSPDLIVLNHRLDLYEAEPYATTYLWQGVETYVDVHSANRETCMHHRGFIFDRGLPEDLERLVEDHGVCISSSVAYFEDDLVYQAFGRCMILSPEIYGNPWLMRDDEYPKLARVYNLHRTVAPLLVDGVTLPATYGHTPVSRGDGSHRFITTGNNAWNVRKVTLKLDGEIGLEATEKKIALIQRFPTEKLVGLYDFGDAVEVELMPFRAHLFEAAEAEKALPVLENCEYEMIREDACGYPLEVKMLCCGDGEITVLEKGQSRPYGTYAARDLREAPPRLLGRVDRAVEPGDRMEALYETAQFAVDNDSLERRELRRSGETAIPEVQAARDAFFGQATYGARGCDGEAVFDGNPDTFFDGQSKWLRDFEGRGLRIDGGCLRVDFGKICEADEVEITCFAAREPISENPKQTYPEQGSYSTDLTDWRDTAPAQITVAETDVVMPVVKAAVHIITEVTGDRVKVRYPLTGGGARYFRLPAPMDRIYSVRLLKDGREVALSHPKASNLQAPFSADKWTGLRETAVTLPADLAEGDYIAVALDGVCGVEGAYCVAEVEGKPVGFPDRAPAYRSNVWEFLVTCVDRNYTYYLPLTPDMAGKDVTIRVLLSKDACADLIGNVWLCPRH